MLRWTGLLPSLFQWPWLFTANCCFCLQIGDRLVIVLFLTVTPFDKVGLAVLGAGMVALLILLATRLPGHEQADAESATP